MRKHIKRNRYKSRSKSWSGSGSKSLLKSGSGAGADCLSGSRCKVISHSGRWSYFKSWSAGK